MRQRPSIEILVGIFMLLGVLAVIFLSLQVSGLTSFYDRQGGYALEARFSNIAGLKPRARVTISGVNVGKVTSIELDPHSYDAVVSLWINNPVEVLEGAVASIYTAGLIGDNYIALLQGWGEPLAHGDEIEDTQDGIVLEELISKYIFNSTLDD